MDKINTLVDKYHNDNNSLSFEEKRYLFELAKESYYNSSIELLSDVEYDNLEKSIGYENKSYIGTKHSEKYTVKHPIIMGSLSKVQIHQSKNGEINWEEYLDAIQSYIGGKKCIVTPKYDGCSFEVVVDLGTCKVTGISGRGDGEYGKDLTNQVSRMFSEKDIKEMSSIANSIYKARFSNDTPDTLVMRGEILVANTLFNTKYSKDYANPRAFVAGMLNREEKNLVEYSDLIHKVYDIRIHGINGWIDVDWTKMNNLIKSIGHFPQFYEEGIYISDVDDLKRIYKKFEEYRDHSEFAQDGIVVKPIDTYRKCNITDKRPHDCVAIKFVPMTKPTTVVDIEWKLGKTNEWIPTIVVEPVVMDGKTITRASAFNYGYLMSKKISVGTKVVLSLAGDIIPFIYKIEDSSNFSIANFGKNFPSNTKVHNIHLMETETTPQHKYLHSALALNIPGFGESNIKKFISYKEESCKPEPFFDIDEQPFPEHVLLSNPLEIEIALGGKTGHNISNVFSKIVMNISLKEIITSCNFRFCGDKVAEQISNKLLGLPYDFSSMPSEGYSWVDDKDSMQWNLLKKIFAYIGWPFDTWYIGEYAKESAKKDNGKIPVILTGEPNDYATKNEFMKLHPEYRITTSWKEVKIVFTNSLDSNTGKMKKAKEKNIEIKLY